MEVRRGSCVEDDASFVLWRGATVAVTKETSRRRRRQQEDQSFPTAAEAFREVYIPNVANSVRCKSERTQSNITLCFDLVPSANQFMASKPKITNTTNNSINDKRQTYASLQFSFCFCDKYLILSSWFIGYRFLYLVLRFYLFLLFISHTTTKQ